MDPQRIIKEALKDPKVRERLAKGIACSVRVPVTDLGYVEHLTKKRDLHREYTENMTMERDLHRYHMAMVSTIAIITLLAMFVAVLYSIRAENLAYHSDRVIDYMSKEHDQLRKRVDVLEAQKINALETQTLACWP